MAVAVHVKPNLHILYTGTASVSSGCLSWGFGFSMQRFAPLFVLQKLNWCVYPQAGCSFDDRCISIRRVDLLSFLESLLDTLTFHVSSCRAVAETRLRTRWQTPAGFQMRIVVSAELERMVCPSVDTATP